MNIYLTRNGQQLGPYTITQLQEMVTQGAVTLADYVWYEGLPNWVPVAQLSGLSFTETRSLKVSHERPVGVWIISLVYFIWVPLSLLGMALAPVMASLNHHDSTMLHHYYETVGLWNYYLPRMVGIGLVFAWTIQFFRLKKNSIYFFLTYLIYGVVRMSLAMTTTLLMKKAPGIFLGVAAIAWLIKGALLYYNWYLIKKGILR